MEVSDDFVRSILANVATVSSAGVIVPRDPAWEIRRFAGGAYLEKEDFELIAGAARSVGDTHAFILEVESLEHEFPPKELALRYVDYEALHDEMISHFDCVLVPRSGRWFVAMYSNDLQTDVFGDAQFMSALKGST